MRVVDITGQLTFSSKILDSIYIEYIRESLYLSFFAIFFNSPFFPHNVGYVNFPISHFLCHLSTTIQYEAYTK